MPINVPLLSEGEVRGFLAAQFVFTTDANLAKSLQVSPEVYLLDAAFNDVYMDKTTDFNHLERMDVPAFTKRLVEQTNAHLGAPLVKAVLIDSFNYTPKNVQD